MEEIFCVHCLDKLSDLGTRDHVFPNSWYTDDTPPTLQRLKAPSCGKCNNSLGAMERELFIRLAMCIQPSKAEASGINSKLLRTFGIGNEDEISEKELRIRRGTLKKIMSEAMPYDPKIKPFPGLGPHKGYPLEAQRSIRVPILELTAVINKIVKGLEYNLSNKRYVREPFKLEVHFVDEQANIAEVYSILEKHGAKKELGPGFVANRAMAHELFNGETSAVIYQIKIWGTLTAYASIMSPEF